MIRRTSRQEGRGSYGARSAAGFILARSLAAAAAVRAEEQGKIVQEFPLHEADPRIVPSDVVESKRREQRLTGIIAIDKRREVALVNPAAERMFAYSEAELQGKPVSILNPERYREINDAQRARWASVGLIGSRTIVWMQV